MKARSPKLAQYLEDTGALYGSPEDIARAKIAYRKEYKASHKKQNAKKWHELRPQFSSQDYACIQHKAYDAGLAPTAYLKAIAINYDTGIVPHRDTLLHILQIVSMATIQLEKENHPGAQALFEAEQLLMEYLQNH